MDSGVLQGLDDDQRRAVVIDAAPLCVLAPAGSGKTRVLTRRIAYRVETGTASADHVLAITFTRRAADELVTRVRQLGLRERVTAGTFHSVAYALLRQYWAERDRKAPELLDRKVGILGPLVRRARPRTGPGAFVQPADIAAEIEWAKARMVNPSRYAAAAEQAGRRPPLDGEVVAELYREYEREKRTRGLADFDDLLLHCARAIEEDEDFASVVRWRYRHLFVDEFQDVNPLQYRLLEAWRGGRPDLCVVGDPNQAIYGWNGADPRFLHDFATRTEGVTVVRLGTNYRSTPQVLAVAHAVLGSRGGLGVRARAQRPDGPLPVVRSFPDEQAEARGIARLVRDRRPAGASWRSVAVLVRTNAQAVPLQRALTDAGVPCRLRAGTLLDAPEVRAWFEEVRRAPLAAALADLDALVADPAAHLDVPDDDGTVSDAHVALLAEVARLGREYQALDPGGTVASLRAWLVATLRSDRDERADAVDLITFHRAKGLEWPIVIVAGFERGYVPITGATTDAARDEELRLCYVAFTRAIDELHVTWAEQRTFGDRESKRSPSPLLADVEACLAALRAGTRPGDWRAGTRSARERLSRAGTSARAPLDAQAEAVLAALRRWRLDQSRSASVPAYVIFSDATLRALAERRPRSARELLAVPGIGPVKAERYGAQVLEIIASAS